MRVPATNSSASSKPAATEPLSDVLIIGAGPAGLTAATYLARFRRDIVVVDAGKSRARWIPTSHNCPGFPMGLEGEQLLKRYRDQAANFGVEVIDACIARLEKQEDDSYLAAAEDGRQWRARLVILASGVVDNMPAMQGLTEAIDCQAIRLCAVCDAFEASDGQIAVFAPVNQGIRHGLFLRSYSNRVCVVPSDDSEPDPRLLQEAKAAAITISGPAASLALKDGKTEVTFADGDTSLFDTVYPVLGSEAQSRLALTLGARHDDNQELQVSKDLETSVGGLYAIGDVVSALNQISVAVGHAAVAATAIHNRLERNFREHQKA